MKDYLESAIKQFQYYKHLGERSMEQLNDTQLFWQFNDDSNSMAIIVNHLWGNMLSRWTDFLNSDGEKEWRNRDLEFESVIKNREALLHKWQEGWKCLFDALASIKEHDYNKTIYIRNQGHSIVVAINRQMMHYAYHVGQMVFLAKMLKGEEWESLSIPKGKSEAYNAEKFATEKHQEHFTDEFLKKKD